MDLDRLGCVQDMKGVGQETTIIRLNCVKIILIKITNVLYKILSNKWTNMETFHEVSSEYLGTEEINKESN